MRVTRTKGTILRKLAGGGYRTSPILVDRELEIRVGDLAFSPASVESTGLPLAGTIPGHFARRGYIGITTDRDPAATLVVPAEAVIDTGDA